MPAPPIPTVPSWATDLNYGVEYLFRSLSAPTLDADGRIDVQAWSASATQDGPVFFGFYTVYVNTNDYTFWRHQVSKPLTTSDEDPGDDSDCRCLFPITAAERLGTVPLGDFVKYNPLDVYFAVPALATQFRIFQGHIKDFTYQDGMLVAVGRGCYRQLDDYARMMAISDDPVEIRDLIANEFSHTNRGNLTGRIEELAAGSATGITCRWRGDGGKATDAIAKWLTVAVDPTTGIPHTVTVLDDRVPALVQRANPETVVTPDYWLDWGVEGLELEVDTATDGFWNVAYAKGTDPGGEDWLNPYPTSTGDVFWEPDEYDPQVHTWDEDGTGGVTNTPGRFEPAAWRSELLFDFSTGVPQDQARAILHQLRLMLSTPGWAGTLALTGIDPRAGSDPGGTGGTTTRRSKFSMRSGQTVGVRWFAGSGSAGVIFRIVQAERDHQANSVRLVVDTKMRDIHWLEAITNREDVKAKNPVARLSVGSDAGLRPARKALWVPAKSGWIPNDNTNGHRYADLTAVVPITGGTWFVVKFLAAEAENIWSFEFHVSPAAPFHVSLYNMDPLDISHTVGLPANPFAVPTGTPPVGPWTDPKPDGFIEGWGSYAYGLGLQRAGFYPHKELNEDGSPSGATATGDFVYRGRGTLAFTHDDAAAAEEAGTGVNEPAYLWLAGMVDAVGSFSGWGRVVRGQVVG